MEEERNNETGLYRCCETIGNLEDGTSTVEPLGVPKLVCKICGRRHFEMSAEQLGK